jgi:hypothetical protein
MCAGAKLTAKLVYQSMQDLDLFDQAVRLRAFSRASTEGVLQGSEFWQARSALREFVLGKLKLVMIVTPLVSGSHDAEPSGRIGIRSIYRNEAAFIFQEC